MRRCALQTVSRNRIVLGRVGCGQTHHLSPMPLLMDGRVRSTVLVLPCRWSTTNSSSTTDASTSAQSPPGAVSAVNPAATSANGSSSMSSRSGDPNIGKDGTEASSSNSSTTTTPAAEKVSQVLIQAVKKRNFAVVQMVVSKGWKEEYSIAVACMFVLFVAYYWTSATQRRFNRLCASTEAKYAEDLHSLREYFNSTKQKYEKELKQRDAMTKSLQKHNAELTRHIDGLTTLLKQCAPRTFQAAEKV